MKWEQCQYVLYSTGAKDGTDSTVERNTGTLQAAKRAKVAVVVPMDR